MTNNTLNSQWITIVLITAVIMLVFLVFYGNKSTPPYSPNPVDFEKHETPQTPKEPKS